MGESPNYFLMRSLFAEKPMVKSLAKSERRASSSATPSGLSLPDEAGVLTKEEAIVIVLKLIF